MTRWRGVSHKKRAEEMNRIYDREVRRGIPNREIWYWFIYPIYGIMERTFYDIPNASADEQNRIADDDDIRQLSPSKDKDYE